MASSMDNRIRALGNEHSRHIKNLKEELENRYKMAVKELRRKLQDQRTKDLDKQKVDLLHKHLAEITKLKYVNNGKLEKMTQNVRRLQNDLEGLHNKSLHQANVTSRDRSMQDNKDRTQRRHRDYEAELSRLKIKDVERSNELRRIRDTSSRELKEMRKDGEKEVKKLLSQLQSKDRAVENLKMTMSGHSLDFSQLERELLNVSWTSDASSVSSNVTTATGKHSSLSSPLPPLSAGLGDSGYYESSGGSATGPVEYYSGGGLSSTAAGMSSAMSCSLNASFQSSTDEETASTMSDCGQPDIVRQTRSMSCMKELKIKKKLSLFKDKLRIANIKLLKISQERGTLIEVIETRDAFVKENKDTISKLENNIRQNLFCHTEDMRKLTEQIEYQDGRIELISKRFRMFRIHMAKEKTLRFIMPTIFEDRMCASEDRSQEEEQIYNQITYSEYETNYRRLSREYLSLQREFCELYTRTDFAADNADNDQDNIEERVHMESQLLDSQVQVERLQEKIGIIENDMQNVKCVLMEKEEDIENLEFQLLECQNHIENCRDRMPAASAAVADISGSSFTDVSEDDDDDDHRNRRCDVTQLAAMLGRERSTVIQLHDTITGRDLQIEYLTKENRSISAKLEEMHTQQTIHLNKLATLSERLDSRPCSPTTSSSMEEREQLLSAEVERLRRQLARVEQDSAHRQREAREDGERVLAKNILELNAKLQSIEGETLKASADHSKFNDFCKGRIEELERIEDELKTQVSKLEEELVICGDSLKEVELHNLKNIKKCQLLEKELRGKETETATLNEMINNLETNEFTAETKKTCLERENKELRTVIATKDKSFLCPRHRTPSPTGHHATDTPTDNAPLTDRVDALTTERDRLRDTLAKLRHSVSGIISEKSHRHNRDHKNADNDVIVHLNEFKEKTSILQKQLIFAESALIKQEEQHMAEVKDLEEKTLDLQKREAKLHNEMKYSASLSACTENNGHHSPLAKIQHLEELVFDLEASERSLQKELNHVNHNETKLGKQMFDNKPDQNNVTNSANKSLEMDILRKKICILEQSERMAHVKATHLLADLERMKLNEVDIHDSMKMQENLSLQFNTIQSLELQMAKQTTEMEHEKQVALEKCKEDRGTIHELSIELHSAKLAESTLIRRIQDIEQCKQNVQMENSKLLQYKEELQIRFDKLLTQKKNGDKKSVEIRDKLKNVEYQLATVEDDMKRATVMMKTKTRELDVKHKEYNELLFEINEVNDEMQRNKVKYQQEKNITTKKLRDLQKELEDLQVLESNTQISLLERDNEVNMLTGQLQSSAGRCIHLEKETADNGRVIVSLQSQLTVIANQDRLQMKILERDAIYEKHRSETLSKELSCCHDDLMRLREHIIDTEKWHTRQKAISDGVSMVTDVNDRVDSIAVMEVPVVNTFDIVLEPIDRISNISSTSSRSEMEDSVSVMLDSESDDDNSFLPQRIDSGIGNSSLRSVTTMPGDQLSSIIDVQCLIEEFNTLRHSKIEDTLDVEEYLESIEDMPKNISKIRELFRRHFTSENYEILKTYFLELLQICIYSQRCAKIYNNERMILRKENITLINLNNKLKNTKDSDIKKYQHEFPFRKADVIKKKYIIEKFTNKLKPSDNRENDDSSPNHREAEINCKPTDIRRIRNTDEAYSISSCRSRTKPLMSASKNGPLDKKLDLTALKANDRQLQRRVSHPAYIRIPDPPTSCEIYRDICCDDTLLIEWAGPNVDATGRNNGHRMKGYKINIDFRRTVTVDNAQTRKARINDMDANKDHNIYIYAFSEDGINSKPLFKLYKASQNEETIREKISSPRQVFIAIYDYAPDEYNAGNCPGKRLPLQAGDIVVTYGCLASNGYYYAKANGRKGYIPGSFVNPIRKLNSDITLSSTDTEDDVETEV